MVRIFLCLSLMLCVPAASQAQVLHAMPAPAAVPETPRLFSGQGVAYELTFSGQYRQVFDLIARRYADRDAVAKLKPFEGAIKTAAERDQRIKELLGQLKDRWTEYRSAADYADAAHLRDLGLVGPGVLLDRSEGGWKVSLVFARSAAEKAGLRAGDRVVTIGGNKLEPFLSQAELNFAISGAIDTEVEIEYVPAGKPEKATTKLKYQPYDGTIVQAKRLAGNVVYVQVTTFMNYNLLREFAAALAAMQNEGDGRIEGVVLDLRGNTGGYMELAFEFAGAFIKSGPIARTVGRDGRIAHETVYTAQGYLPELLKPTARNLQLVEALQSKPMVVLVNGSTMSAAEMLTNALKDSGRAEIIGERTWGKGVSFNTFPAFGGELQLVTGTFAGPSGYQHNGKGITPHTVVSQPRHSAGDPQLEAALAAVARKPETAAVQPAPGSVANAGMSVGLAFALVTVLVFLLAAVFGLMAYWLSRRYSVTPVRHPEPDFSWTGDEPEVVAEVPALATMDGELASALIPAEEGADELENVDMQILAAGSYFIGTPCQQCGHRFEESDVITHKAESSGCFSYCLHCAQTPTTR